jgi:hypothetical protein
MNNLMGDISAQWNDNGSVSDIEMQQQKEEEDNQYVSTFFSDVDSINADIKAIAQASKDVNTINGQSMRVTTTADE